MSRSAGKGSGVLRPTSDAGTSFRSFPCLKYFVKKNKDAKHDIKAAQIRHTSLHFCPTHALRNIQFRWRIRLWTSERHSKSLIEGRSLISGVSISLMIGSNVAGTTAKKLAPLINHIFINGYN